MAYPHRIVCLTEETVETLYLLGEEHRIAGVSGYAVRPPRVRREKPRVSAFITADVPKILALNPDLVLTFSDLQADIAAELIRQGVAVHAFNQRDVAGILDDDPHARRAGRRRAPRPTSSPARWSSGWRRRAQRAARLPRRPRVYFEEWDEPMISGIGWVSELIEAGRRRRRVRHARPRQERQGPHRHRRAGDRGAGPTSSSARGAARNSCRRKWPPGPVSTRSRRCATGSCARSNRR